MIAVAASIEISRLLLFLPSRLRQLVPGVVEFNRVSLFGDVGIHNRSTKPLNAEKNGKLSQPKETT